MPKKRFSVEQIISQHAKNVELIRRGLRKAGLPE